MSIALSSKNKYDFVDGTITYSTHAQLWSRCNDMVISWILYTIFRNVSDIVLCVTTEAQLWKELKDHMVKPMELSIISCRRISMKCLKEVVT